MCVCVCVCVCKCVLYTFFERRKLIPFIIDQKAHSNFAYELFALDILNFLSWQVFSPLLFFDTNTHFSLNHTRTLTHTHTHFHSLKHTHLHFSRLQRARRGSTGRQQRPLLHTVNQLFFTKMDNPKHSPF